MELITPNISYKKSFLEALAEYQIDRADDRLDLLALDSDVLSREFEPYVRKLHDESEGKQLPKGYVPQTTYWLVDGTEFIGRINIRHELTPFLLRIGGHIGYDIRPSKRKLGYGKKMLALALPKAKALGITKVLITCNETNIGSQKIIEANGGILENRESQGENLPLKLRYWISLS